ncbi:hypothetical protein PPACK8108_LOCUS5578 [Phakopsora pachyrhizi]|uniref:Flavin reductase like domain-containing protein n=1 Tax=Phakopsora pachyrhizi TaxID=170000 RepID=A0AAV0AT76_PHAPC|nr:hypothetical protein PPACK8108_LOCUS5578 [Phakopsora pachyrhizi]
MSSHPPFKQVENSRPDFKFDEKFEYTKTPQPDWKPGQGISDAPLPNREIYSSSGPIKTFIPYENLSVADGYKLMISAIVPRPIAFCSTLSEDGKPNLAPFSYFNAVGFNPPAVMVSITKNPTAEKDTALNIKKTKEFVVAIISEPFIEAANYTAIDSPPEVSEWDLSGLNPVPSLKVKPARVKEASVNMECELDSTKLTQTCMIGRIKAWHIKEDIMINDGPTISIEKLMPMGRLGGISYSRVNSGFELDGPVWKDEVESEEVKRILTEKKKN